MKRPRSSDDLEAYVDKDSSAPRSSWNSYHGKPENSRKCGTGYGSSPLPSSRYDRDRSGEDEMREGSRKVRKRSEHDFDGLDRRKVLGLGFGRYGGREGHNSSSGSGGSLHRSSGREFPTGFRSERERSRKEGSGTMSWRRFGCGTKELEESSRALSSSGRECGNEERASSIALKESTRASPKGLKREVKSPTRSRDSGSEQSRSVEAGKKSEQARGSVATRNCGGSARDDGKAKSSTSKSKSSPSWSKDSESERSKSVEVRKVGVDSEEMEAKSKEVETKSSNLGIKDLVSRVKNATTWSSEIEEGELEQEHDVAEEKDCGEKVIDFRDEIGDDQKKARDEIGTSEHMDSVRSEDSGDCFGKGDMIDETPIPEKGVIENEMKEADINDTGDEPNDDDFSRAESMDDISSQDADVQGKGFDLEARLDDSESKKQALEEHGGTMLPMAGASMQTCKDKGKRIVLSSSDADSAKDSLWVERVSGEVDVSKEAADDMEGPSTRGFELFSSSPVRRAADQALTDKEKDSKLKLEPLDLSLSLPNVLLPIGATKDSIPPRPGSPSQGRSMHSLSTFRTNSDGFAASMSISGSQSFFHNPSCSLTQNSLDMENYEQSVHSRAIFQGLDLANVQSDSKHKDFPLYHKLLANGNGYLPQSQVLQPKSHALGGGSSKMPNSMDKQLSLQKRSGGQARNNDDTRSPSQSVGSHDIGSTYSFEKKLSMKDKHGVSLYRSGNQKDQDSLQMVGTDFVDNVVGKIVSEPFYVMARKFHDMPLQTASILKESIGDMLINVDKQGQISVFQTALRNRTDLTLDNLLKCHRIQLEILVALKTGIKDYLLVDSGLSSADLAEIFLNVRCRNPTCRNPVPVDECDCKVCSKKTGFCSECTCLVCSKFDTASNTCSWIGCDVCMHWCHADCALRESFVRNGRSASGGQGPPEMQFHCVACDLPSEMFGFVKGVFQSFAKEWSADKFAKELDYVRRIFNASKDVRGRRLYELADRMISRLVIKSNLPEVYRDTMNFLTESDSSHFSNPPAFPGKEVDNAANGIAGPSQDSSWLKAASSEVPRSNRSSSLLPALLGDINDKSPGELKSHSIAEKEPLFAELESIVRLKQAEADIFQARADEARREADSLRRIAFAKNENIDEEYNKRLAKLRLPEAEEMRKHKFEEFQALERAHREFSSMKRRMEADIEDLLLKMESTKRNLAV